MPVDTLDLSRVGYAVAFIDESVCIGCTLCIKACPVDAIVGATKLMHTIISAECTGCELCIPPCPVDCIVMNDINVSDSVREQRNANAVRRQQRQQQRLARQQAQKAARLRAKRIARGSDKDDPRKAVIAAAVARVRANKTKKF